MVHRRMSLKRIKSIAGDRFGHLVAVQFAGLTPLRKAKWICQCDCGGTTVAQLGNLRSGHSQSCGCVGREGRRKGVTTHGLSHTKEYRVWVGMKKRCENVKTPVYSDYGGRGIRVCSEWRIDFVRFLTDMGPCPEGHSIERINNDGNYQPDNCRWIPKPDQGANRRNNHRITVRGESHTLAEWGRILGVPASRISARLRSGWSPDRALTAPLFSREIQ
jgi:hypothetical protein